MSDSPERDFLKKTLTELLTHLKILQRSWGWNKNAELEFNKKEMQEEKKSRHPLIFFIEQNWRS